MPTPPNIKPSYVPNGYFLRRELRDAAADGFRGAPDQVTLVYTLGWEPTDWHYKLGVYIGPGDAGALYGTEGKAGTQIDLGRGDAEVVYHDGMWALGPGADENWAGGYPTHWETTEFHSLTITLADAVVGVRGPKARGVGFAQLVDVARSIIE